MRNFSTCVALSATPLTMSKKEKGEKVKKLNEADATKATLEFLRRVRHLHRWSLTYSQNNRPYNAQMIVDMLKGAVSKAAMDKVRDTEVLI